LSLSPDQKSTSALRNRRANGISWIHTFKTAAESAPFVTSAFYPDLGMLPVGWHRHVGTPRYSSFSLVE
jgi:hypothetical protein